MKKEGKIKIEGRDFILVPKRDFLNLLQSLYISVLNKRMLILQMATTLLVLPRDLCRALPSSHKELKFFKALAGLESLVQFVMDSWIKMFWYLLRWSWFCQSHTNAWEVCEAQLWVQEPAACLGAGGRANQHFLPQRGRRTWHSGQAPCLGLTGGCTITISPDRQLRWIALKSRTLR